VARRTVIELTDDLDGSPANETVTFSLDGTDMEIDLSQSNAEKLRGALRPFVDAARKADGGRRGVRRGRRGGAATARNADQTRAIREWAKQQGMEVSERGRIPAKIQDAYNAAH
jgi:Lsr2